MPEPHLLQFPSRKINLYFSLFPAPYQPSLPSSSIWVLTSPQALSQAPMGNGKLLRIQMLTWTDVGSNPRWPFTGFGSLDLSLRPSRVSVSPSGKWGRVGIQQEISYSFYSCLSTRAGVGRDRKCPGGVGQRGAWKQNAPPLHFPLGAPLQKWLGPIPAWSSLTVSSRHHSLSSSLL